MSALLTERYKDDLLGVLSCFDRVVITGTLPGACYAKGMTSYLYANHIKIFDYAKEFADPMRKMIRENALTVANAHEIDIEFVGNASIRKEDLVAKVLAVRGDLKWTQTSRQFSAKFKM